MVQLDWATGCPGGWSNVTLGVSMRVHLDKIDTQLNKLRRPPSLVWMGYTQSVEGWNTAKRRALPPE